MNVIILCEESQTVCKEFRKLGHNAFSCDIIACSGGRPEWHILGDASKLCNSKTFETLDGHKHSVPKWDIAIAHPPCTYLSNAGVRWLSEERLRLASEAVKFFMQMLMCSIDRVCVENPTPSKIHGLPECDQVIQPYEFGDPFSKRTCLWLKNLPKLTPTNILSEYETTSTARWYNSPGGDRRASRSKTFPGIARAMAEQWSAL